MIVPFSPFLVNYNYDFLASITLSDWKLISHKTFFIQNHSSYKNPNEFSLLHCHVVSYILSKPISHIHILFLLMYNLSTSLIVSNAPYIVIVFLDFLFTFFNSLSFYCSIPVPYLNSATVHVFIAVVLFFPFSFRFRINRSLRLIYSFIVFVFSFHPL